MINKNSKENLISKTDIKSILKKKFKNNKLRTLKINIKSFNLSDYNDNILLFKEKNKNKNKLEYLQSTNFQNNSSSDFFKVKLKNKHKIDQFKKIKYDENNIAHKFIYNNSESNNNLKKYTNNSSSFQHFSESIKKSYHKYSVNKIEKIEKSVLLKTPREKNIIYNKFNYLKNKENKKTFIKLPPIKLQMFSDLIKKDSELYDEVDMKILENEKLIKKIRLSLLQDINPDEKNNKLYLNYLKSITNYINYFQDIYMTPHIRNNFSFCHSVNNLDYLNEKICNRNFLHKKIVLSMNRIIILRQLIKEEKEKERKQMLEEIQQKPILKWKNYGETKLSLYEKQFEKYELQDSFEKCMNHQIISFADKKLRNLIFSKFIQK